MNVAPEAHDLLGHPGQRPTLSTLLKSEFLFTSLWFPVYPGICAEEKYQMCPLNRLSLLTLCRAEQIRPIFFLQSVESV